jgi:acetyl-CoA acetyltransferase
VRAVIAGVGMTPLSPESDDSELALAVSAIRAALEDAELEPEAVDGFVAYAYDRVGIAPLQRALGVPELRLFAEVPYGGGASCGTIAQAAAAIDAGLASCVVCYRAMKGRSGTRLGRAERNLEHAGEALVCRGDRVPAGVFAAPAGLLSPAQTMALWAHRYAHDHGLDDDRLSHALGAIAVTQRAYAQTNPRAVTRGKPLSLDDYLAGRMIASPLRVYDLCRENDGAAAVVLTAPRRSRRRAARVVAASQQLFPYSDPLPVYPPDITRLTTEREVSDLFAQAGVSRSAVDLAIIYDATTIAVLLSLEDYGICDRGGAPEFLGAGQHGPGGLLPINPHGGLLSEGYVHGLNSVIEAVRQVRNEADNQVSGAELALVTVRGGALLLGAQA